MYRFRFHLCILSIQHYLFALAHEQDQVNQHRDEGNKTHAYPITMLYIWHGNNTIKIDILLVPLSPSCTSIYIYIYIYIYTYIFTNLISTSIHGYQKKRKKPCQEHEIKISRITARGKKKKYHRTKRKKTPTPSHSWKKSRDMQSVGQKKTKTLRKHCNATITRVLNTSGANRKIN